MARLFCHFCPWYFGILNRRIPRVCCEAQVGDRIVAVNGTSGASQAIFDVIKDTQEAQTGNGSPVAMWGGVQAISILWGLWNSVR